MNAHAPPPGTPIHPEQAVAVDARSLGLARPGDADIARSVPVEAPVAIEVNGLGYAVMMATPHDLRDFAVGFALSEGLVADRRDVHDAQAVAVEGGWVLRLDLRGDGAKRAAARARVRVSESSCGLCGMDNIAQVLRPLPPVTARLEVTRAAIARALDALPQHQPLGQATGAVHAAAFCTAQGDIVRAREDVGRHNALDKLLGALARADLDATAGFILLTARCSYELVEKTVRAGCPMLVTISAPTSLAVERASRAGLTLVTLARPDAILVVSGLGTIAD